DPVDGHHRGCADRCPGHRRHRAAAAGAVHHRPAAAPAAGRLPHPLRRPDQDRRPRLDPAGGLRRVQRGHEPEHLVDHLGRPDRHGRRGLVRDARGGDLADRPCGAVAEVLLGRPDRHRFLRLEEVAGRRPAAGLGAVRRSVGRTDRAAAEDLPPDPAGGGGGAGPALRRQDRRIGGRGRRGRPRGGGAGAVTGRPGRGPARPRLDPVGLVFALALPLLGAALILTATALWSDRLPDPLATHWSGSDGPDGFSGLWTNAWTLAAVLIVVGGGCAAPAAFARVQLMVRRILLVTAMIVIGLITAVALSMLVTQLDLADPSRARLSWWPMGAGVAVGTAVGLLGAWLLRDRRVPVPASAPPDPALPRRAARTALTLTAG